ncbi:Sodium channel protein Nach, partial [Pseudolycoriella hygida]
MRYLSQGSAFTSNIAYNVYELSVLQTILNENRVSTVKAMEAINLPCSDLLVRCRFEYQIQPCMELFEQSISYLGICCTFNGQNNFKFEWSSFTVHTGGLSLIVKPTHNFEYSTTYSRDVKLLIHKSVSYPSDLNVMKILSQQSESTIRIYSDVTRCSNEVKSLTFAERDCILPSEKTLRYFPRYAENNCNVECRIIQTIELCGCLPYNYFVTSSAPHPICNFTKIDCLVSNYLEIHESQMQQNGMCKCPPDCNAVSFDASMTKIPFTLSNFSVDNLYEGLDESQYVIAHISFGKQVYKELRRDLLINVIILASGLGGIYSLFIGMGVLTFFEIFYFLTFRLRAHYVRIRREHQVLCLKSRKIIVKEYKPKKLA